MGSQIPGSGPVKFTDIENEFGRIPGIGKRKIGDYRNTFNFGELALPLADGIPTSGAVKFSDFRNKEVQMVMDYYNDSHRSVNVKDDYDNKDNVLMVGPETNLVPPINGGGKRIRIHVNNEIGQNNSSSDGSYKICAMRTGDDWEAGTELKLDVGGNGLIIGAGGDGGNGGVSSGGERDGASGGNGNSALGIEWNNTEITVMNNDAPQRRVTSSLRGAIAGGGGGGGGGGGAKQRDWNGYRWKSRYSAGAGGGGGAGIPAGLGGASGGDDPTDTVSGGDDGGPGINGITPTAENIATIDNAAGGSEGEEAGEARGGHGGAGGAYQTIMSSDGAGVDNPSRMRGEGGEDGSGDKEGEGGAWGYGGSAIRRTNTDINWTFGTGHEGTRVWGNGWQGPGVQDGGGVNADPPLDNENGIDTF